jgi:hypothetical protein
MLASANVPRSERKPLFGVKRHKIEVILQYGSGHLKLWM